MIKHEKLEEDKFSNDDESNSSESEDELSSPVTNYKGIWCTPFHTFLEFLIIYYPALKRTSSDKVACLYPGKCAVRL